MRTLTLSICLFLIHCNLAGQNMEHRSLDKLGWEMKDFSMPDNLTEVDTGSVRYLIRLNRTGKIKHLQILNNTFPLYAEKRLRQFVRKGAFIRSSEPEASKIKYTGTLLITRGPCNEPVSSPEQIQLFNKQ